MGKFSKRPSLKEPENFVRSPPEKCQCEGCEADATLLLCEVEAGNESKVGAFTEFGQKLTGKDGSVMVMTNGHVFKRWIARCSECYGRELCRAGKGALQSIFRYTEEEVKKSAMTKHIELLKR